MTRSLVRWIRVVLPDSSFIAGGIGGEVVIEVTFLLLLACGWPPDEQIFRRLRLGWLATCALLYGVSRIASFHPVLNDHYFAWLQMTPWKAGMPLPGGPIHQVPQDLVVLFGLMVLTREASVLALVLPAAHLCGYLFVLAVASRACGDWQLAYLLAFGLGAVALGIPSPLACCIVAIACYPLAYLAVRRSMNRYPWKIDRQRIMKYSKQNSEEMFRDRMGWPFDFLAPKAPAVWLPYPDGVCLSLLLGWIAFIIHVHCEPHGRELFCGFASQVLSIPVLIRIALYMSAHRWPINLSGRIFTLRWIVPKYDVIYVAPVLSIATLLSMQLAAVYLLIHNRPFGQANVIVNPALEWLAIVCSSFGVTCGCLVLLIMGPVLERWRLTGAHRIVFDQSGLGSKNSQSQFVEV